MDDNKFWLAIWRTIGLAVVGIAVTVAACVSNTTYQIRQELVRGIDPMQVACANESQNSATPCIILAVKRVQ